MRDVLDVRPATEPLFIALLIDTIRPAAGVLAPTQDFRRGLAAFVSTIKGGNPDAQIAILDYPARRSPRSTSRARRRRSIGSFSGCSPTGRPTPC